MTILNTNSVLILCLIFLFKSLLIQTPQNFNLTKTEKKKNKPNQKKKKKKKKKPKEPPTSPQPPPRLSRIKWPASRVKAQPCIYEALRIT